MSFKTRVSSLFNVNPRTRKVITFLAKNADTLAKFATKPTLLGGIDVALKTSDLLAELNTANDACSWFTSHGFEQFYSDRFSDLLRRLVMNFPCEVYDINSFTKVEIYELPNNAKIGFSVSNAMSTGSSHVARENFVLSGDLEETQKIIKSAIWGKYTSDGQLTMSAKSTFFGDYERHDGVEIYEDTIIDAYVNDTCMMYVDDIKSALKQGLSRSMMLYGPPGTGKTSMAKSISKMLGFKSILISGSDLSELSTSFLQQIIELFTPDTIIIDDLDRCKDKDKLLMLLQFFMKSCKLVISTVNDISEIDSALMRPGRFDEVIPFEKLDERVIKDILGEECSDLFEKVQSWPVSYINELMKRVSYMGKERALQSLKDLEVRIQRALKQYNVDKINDLPSSSKKDEDDVFSISSY